MSKTSALMEWRTDLTAQGDISFVLIINTGHCLHAQYVTCSTNPNYSVMDQLLWYCKYKKASMLPFSTNFSMSLCLIHITSQRKSVTGRDSAIHPRQTCFGALRGNQGTWRKPTHTQEIPKCLAGVKHIETKSTREKKVKNEQTICCDEGTGRHCDFNRKKTSFSLLPYLSFRPDTHAHTYTHTWPILLSPRRCVR